jgi:hypothetical protein
MQSRENFYQQQVSGLVYFIQPLDMDEQFINPQSMSSKQDPADMSHQHHTVAPVHRIRYKSSKPLTPSHPSAQVVSGMLSNMGSSPTSAQPNAGETIRKSGSLAKLQKYVSELHPIHAQISNCSFKHRTVNGHIFGSRNERRKERIKLDDTRIADACTYNAMSISMSTSSRLQ